MGNIVLLGAVAVGAYLVYQKFGSSGVQSTIPNEAGVLQGIAVATDAIAPPLQQTVTMPPVPVPPPGLGWLW
jgi:hypothetical protein